MLTSYQPILQKASSNFRFLPKSFGKIYDFTQQMGGLTGLKVQQRPGPDKIRTLYEHLEKSTNGWKNVYEHLRQ